MNSDSNNTKDKGCKKPFTGRKKHPIIGNTQPLPQLKGIPFPLLPEESLSLLPAIPQGGTEQPSGPGHAPSKPLQKVTLSWSEPVPRLQRMSVKIPSVDLVKILEFLYTGGWGVEPPSCCIPRHSLVSTRHT